MSDNVIKKIDQLEKMIGHIVTNMVTKEEAKKFATKDDLNGFATKDDLNGFATKDDLNRFATKDDLNRFATKDDLNRFATKDDLNRFATKDDLKLFPTKDDIKAFATKDDLLNTKNEIITKLTTRIDQLDERIHDVFASADKNKVDRIEFEPVKKRVEKLERKVHTTN